jgi:hypothetical protein
MEGIHYSAFPCFGLRMNHPWIGHPSFSRNLVNSSDGFSTVASKSISPSTLNPHDSYNLSPISVASIYDGKPSSSAFSIPHSINSRPTPRRRCLGCVKQKLSTVHRENTKLACTMESKLSWEIAYIYGARSSASGGNSGNHGEADLLYL